MGFFVLFWLVGFDFCGAGGRMVFFVSTCCFGFFKYLFSFVFLCFLVVLFLNTVLKKISGTPIA